MTHYVGLAGTRHPRFHTLQRGVVPVHVDVALAPYISARLRHAQTAARRRVTRLIVFLDHNVEGNKVEMQKSWVKPPKQAEADQREACGCLMGTHVEPYSILITVVPKQPITICP